MGWSINGQLARPEPTRILVKPRAGVRQEELAGLHAKSGCRLHRRFPTIGGLEVVEVAAPMAREALLERYRNSALIEYCELDGVVRAAYSPNDFRFIDGTLWSLHNTGQNGGTADADIDAPEGWDIQRDASSIIVAVIDSGVRYTHEDLAANMWQNTGEVPANRIDEDGNGYYNDVHGINAIRQSGDPMDDHGHGTHVAGIIGALGDNSVGCVGVAPRVQIMALKFLNTNLFGFISDAIECIDYARVKGARIINASWGDHSDFTSVALRDAIARARDAGIIFVAAAGNDSENNDTIQFYPANYDVDNIVVVAATTRFDTRATWSHYGASTVDLGAPGQDVYSTWADSNSSYDTISGTSMAAPHVAGACALVWARYPSLTYREVIQRVLNGVDPLSSLAGRTVTGGRLNLQKALTPVNSPPVLAPIGNKTVDEGSQLLFTATASDADGGALTFSLDSGAPVGATINPTTGVFSWTPSESHGGSANAVTIRVTDSASASDFETVTINVREVNAAPVLSLISNQTNSVGNTISFRATATDADLPGNLLAFGLVSGGPAGSAINATTGDFSWTPTDAQAPSTNVITVRVADNGSPALEDSQAVMVVVYERLRITTARSADASSVNLTWTSVPGKTYQIQYRNSLQAAGWTNVGPVIPANNQTTSATTSAAGGRRFFRIVQTN
jgi:subtilisin family serine protease